MFTAKIKIAITEVATNKQNESLEFKSLKSNGTFKNKL